MAKKKGRMERPVQAAQRTRNLPNRGLLSQVKAAYRKLSEANG